MTDMFSTFRDVSQLNTVSYMYHFKVTKYKITSNRA